MTSPSQPSTRDTAGQWVPSRWVKVGLITLLTALALVAIAPAYLTGQWPWREAPEVMQLEPLQALQTTGLALPGWQLDRHQSTTINQQDWSVNEYTATSDAMPVSQMAVLLHPQPWHSNQPQVEWVDLIGAQNWRVDSRRRLSLTGTQAQANVFRGWNDQQTFAVVQWYAWPTGGHPSPGAWFWANQRSQLIHHHLTPWVAVTLLVPTAPLAPLDPAQLQLADLGGLVHQQVVAAIAPATP
jgi:cyanoexosortase B-associated protein